MGMLRIERLSRWVLRDRFLDTGNMIDVTVVGIYDDACEVCVSGRCGKRST